MCIFELSSLVVNSINAATYFVINFASFLLWEHWTCSLKQCQSRNELDIYDDSDIRFHHNHVKTSYSTQLKVLRNDSISMSVGHLDHVLIVYSLMEHVTWKSPGPMCGSVGRILCPNSCTSVSSWSKVPLLSIWSVAMPLCRPLLPCPSWWYGSRPRHCHS